VIDRTTPLLALFDAAGGLPMAWDNLLDEPIMHFVSQPPNSVLRLRYDEPQWSLSAQWDFD
jgi:hypothetical protein